MMPPTRPEAETTTTQGAHLNVSLRSMWRQLVLLVVVCALAGLTAGVLTWLQPTKYKSTVTMVVPAQTGATDSETAVRSVRALLGSFVVGADLKAATGTKETPRQILRHISATRPPGSSVLTVSVTDSSKATSTAVASQLLPVFTKRLAEVSPTVVGRVVPALSISSFGGGVVTTQKVSPPALRNTLIGVGLGLLLGIMILALRLQRRPLLTSVEQAEATLGVPVLAAIPSLGGRSSKSWAGANALQLALRGGSAIGWGVDAGSIAIAAPANDRAQRQVVVALARAVAADGHNVIIVDTDLERHVVSSMFHADRRRGLAELLKTRSAASAADLVSISFAQDKSFEGADSVGTVRLLPAGQDRDAYGTLRNAALASILSSLRSEAFVIVSAPRVPGPVPSNELLQSVDAILLVATLRDVHLNDARTTADAVRALASGRAVAALLTGADQAQWRSTSADAEFLLA